MVAVAHAIVLRSAAVARAIVLCSAVVDVAYCHPILTLIFLGHLQVSGEQLHVDSLSLEAIVQARLKIERS